MTIVKYLANRYGFENLRAATWTMGMCLLTSPPSISAQLTYTYEGYDAPSARSTELFGINNFGQTTGFKVTNTTGNPFVAFVLNIDTKDFRAIPTTAGIAFNGAGGINDNNAFILQGDGQTFVTRDFGVTLDKVSVPGSDITGAIGINNSSEVTGVWFDAANIGHGFIRQADGNTYVTFDPPYAFSTESAVGVNADGVIVGFYTSAATTRDHAYIRSLDGTFQAFDADPSPGQSVFRTDPGGINTQGEIVGFVVESPNNTTRGFIRSSDGKTFTPIAFPGAAKTIPRGINDSGVIVGVYEGVDLVPHGFIARPAAGSVSLSYTSWNFSPRIVGETSGPGHVAVQNNTSVPLNVTFSLGGADPGEFTVTSTDCQSPLAAGAHCTAYFTFTPITTGFRTASLLVSYNTTGSPQTVALGGQGQGAILDVSPEVFQFAVHPVGETSGPGKIFLYAHGGLPVTVTGITLGGANPNDFAFANNCPGTIPSGVTCSLLVTTKPTAQGIRTAVLTVTTDPPLPTAVVTLREFAK